MWDVRKGRKISDLISQISNLDKMNLEILTPDKKVFEGEVTAVTVPGTLGSFQILKGHAPIISTLEDGPVIVKATNDSQTFNIKGGVVEVLDDKVIVLAEAILA